jgi:hypothetical protein
MPPQRQGCLRQWRNTNGKTARITFRRDFRFANMACSGSSQPAPSKKTDTPDSGRYRVELGKIRAYSRIEADNETDTVRSIPNGASAEARAI